MSTHNLKTIRQKFKDRGVFYTPPELAAMIRSYAPETVSDVYDPTCGDGALLAQFGEAVKKYGREIDEEQLDVARQNLGGSFAGKACDTLAPESQCAGKFACIVANPPFSIKWGPKDCAPFNMAGVLPPPSRADYAFLLHIIASMADDGVAVVMQSPGVLYRGQKEGKIRQWLVEQGLLERVVHIPGRHFVDTAIATCIMVLRKGREAGAGIVFECKETGRETIATIDQVKAQEYGLSVSLYLPAIQREDEPKSLNPNAIEMQLREDFIKSMRAQIEISRAIETIGGAESDSFIDRIMEAAEAMRRPKIKKEKGDKPETMGLF